MKQLLIFCLVSLLSIHTYAQSDYLQYDIETGVSVSTGAHTPFWLVANKYGVSSIKRNTAYLSAGVFHQENPLKKFSYAWGLELAGAHRFTSGFFVQQAYLDLRYHDFVLSIGSKERGSELKNDALSTGGLSLSSNARPVPQVRISIPDFVPIPGCRNWLHVKGHLAYGRFTDDSFQTDYVQGKNKYTKNALYHSKALFVKLENEKIPFSVTAGIEMMAQFGGDCYYPNGHVYRTPHKLKDFFKVLLPGNGDGDASESDQINVLGNHLGSYHLAVEYRFPTWKVRGYYEHPFEDHSGMEFAYGMWEDCLVGLEVTFPKNRIIESLVAEYLYTKDQSGAFHFLNYNDNALWGRNYTGADNYYNNGQYTGWEHWGMGLGNPLLTSPIYNGKNDLTFRNNRVEGFHVGLNGEPVQGLRYRFLLSATRNWGTYDTPFDDIENNWNGLAELSYSPGKWKGWTFTLSAAADAGDLLGRSTGGMITIRKTGGFNL